MKKVLLWIIIVVAVVAYRLVWKYNTIISYDENVQQMWWQVENVYQRRVDLIPNLVETVKWYANQEKDTFTAVTEARAKASQTNIDINSAEALAQYQQSQGQLTAALSRLLVVMEQYPELKSNQNFLELQAELAWTENRITVERMRYNESVGLYNVYVRRIPQNFIAMLFGFDAQKLYFESEDWAEQAPEVNFANTVSSWAQNIEAIKSEIEATQLQIQLENAKKQLEATKSQQ